MNTNIVIKIGEANTTIEGNPIELKGIELSYQLDANAQEMATSGGILNNVYDKIQEMAKSFNTPTPTPTITPASTKSNTSFCEIQNKEKPKKVEQLWDLPAIWGVMMKSLPDGFKKTGIGSYTFETTEEKVKNKIKVQIEFNEDSIDMDIYTGSTAIHGYLYSEAKRSRITGINPALLNAMFEEMPDEIKEFVKNYFDRITK